MKRSKKITTFIIIFFLVIALIIIGRYAVGLYFKKNDIDYSKPSVFMCGSGVTACVLGLAYFLISDKNAVIYDGSFAEWGKK